MTELELKNSLAGVRTTLPPITSSKLRLEQSASGLAKALSPRKLTAIAESQRAAKRDGSANIKHRTLAEICEEETPTPARTSTSNSVPAKKLVRPSPAKIVESVVSGERPRSKMQLLGAVLKRMPSNR
jgi:hypothetical protein